MKYFLLFLILLFVFSSCSTNEIRCYNETIAKVSGDSMSPLIEHGEEHILISGECINISRGDVVIYKYPDRNDPLVKQVKAIHGDSFAYEKPKIYVNGEVLKNSVGNEYKINSNLLPLYAESYPIIQKNTYLILGDSETGSLDASEFGLVDRKDIIGKLLLE